MARKSSKSSPKTDGTVTLTAVPQPATPVAPTASVTQTVVKPAQPVTTKNLLKKPDFLDRAIARTTVKKRDAKPAIEAALAELAALLADGTELNLPPLGKLKIVKSKDIGEGAQVMTLKLRTMKDRVDPPQADQDGDS